MEILNDKLTSAIDEGTKKFISLINEKEINTIRIISHNDTDGITSAAIIAKVLKRLNLQYWLTNLKSFDESALETFEREEWDLAFILDFGLNEERLQRLDKINKKIFILDHHILDVKDKEINFHNIILINSFLFDEDLATAGLAYLFGKDLSVKNKDLAYISIIGLIGDMSKIPESIIKDGVESKKVIAKKSLKIFGTSTKPLHKALAFSNTIIPGISGNEKEALELIKQAGIDGKENGRYRTFLDLSEEEAKKLCTLIAARGLNSDFLDFVYLINSNGNLYDSKEFSTIINSCGRLGCSEIGIEACYGKLTGAEKIYQKYKKEIVSALNWFEKNKNEGNGKFLEACNGKVYVINAGNEIKDTVIGVFISMLTNDYKDKILIGMAERGENIKISARASNVNVKEFLDKLFNGIEIESGGHKQAAGGLISKADEKTFIGRIKSLAEW